MTLANAQVVAEIPDSAIGGPVCSGCGASPRQNRDGSGHERIVATGWFIDYEGQVVFCETCICYLGSLIGLINPETSKVRTSDVRRAERRDKKVREADEALAAAAACAENLRDTIAALRGELGMAG